jgi:hypothetical protein
MSLRGRFLREVAAAGLPADAGAAGAAVAPQIAGLPEAAQRYLKFMGVAERHRDWSFRVGFTGRFRTRPRRRWMNCEAWQYNSLPALARIFHIRIRFGGLLAVIGRDTYVDGRGRMLIRLLDRFTLEDGTGEAYDMGELVTYLGDAVLIAPSMLLEPRVSWASVDANSFDVALTDHGRTVSARVVTDDRGAPREFSTDDRFCYDPDHPKQLMRAHWTTPVAGWQLVDGRALPTGAQAVWHLPQGPFAYADFRPIHGSLAFNVAPGA